MKLKINFTDFWNGFDKNDNLFVHLLSKEFEVVVSEEPDVLFFSCYGFDYLKYKCHRVYFTGEDVQPDHRLCDFSISFKWDTLGGKNMRLPLFRFNGALETLTESKYHQPLLSIPSKFCCTVVSNAGCKERNDFFDTLSSYKTVDSGGRYRNNVGGPVEIKEAFVKDYKFVLSFENVASEGYTTEKIIDSFFKRNVPIYWGNKLVGKDFNTARFVNVQDYISFDAAIESIIKIDEDDSLYQKYITQPVFTGNDFPAHLQWKVLETKLVDGVKGFLNQTPVAITNAGYALQDKLKRKVVSKITKKPIWHC